MRGDLRPGTASADRPETLATVCADLDNEIERLVNLASALEGLTNRIGGSRPTEVDQQAQQPATPNSSLLDNLQRKRRLIALTLSRCENELSRIETALG